MQKSKPPSKNIYFHILSVFFIIIVCLPELLTWGTLPNRLVFNGVLANIDDANVYMSAIRQGSEGKWFFRSQFTPESVPDIFSYFPYLLMGKFLSIIGGTVILWYQILRFGAAVFSLIALVLLIKEFFPDQKKLQNTSFILILFGSGISWLLMIFANQIPTFAAELNTPEWNLVSASLSAPHFLLGIGFQATFFVYLNKLLLNPGAKQIINLLIAGTFLSFSYPFLIAVDGLVIGSYLVFETIKQKSIPWKKMFQLLISTIPMIGMLLYYGYYIPNVDSLAQTLLQNNQVVAPDLRGILAGYGFLLFFALFGFKTLSASHSGRIVIIWMLVNTLCLFLPFSLTGRWVLALFIPICLLASQGIENVTGAKIDTENKKKIFSSERKRWLLIIFTFPSTMLFLVFSIHGPKSNLRHPYYYQQEEISAVKWLSNQTNEKDIIFAEYPLGNLFPRYSPAKVFIGHLNLTINLDAKISMFRKFWSPEINQNWRSEFIEQWGITYIYMGQYERSLSSGSVLPPGEVVYDQDGIMIFHILP